MIERELDIAQITLSMATNVRQEIIRKLRNKEVGFPYAYMAWQSLAAVKELQNNYAVQKHGVRFNMAGQRATTTKGYLFPITLGLDFHYIDSDPQRLLTMCQALVLLSLTDGLSFKIDVGTIFSFVVRLEIPLETTINLEEMNAQDLPGASDINVQIIMHTTVGFFRDVSAVNGDPQEMIIQLADTDSFNVPLPKQPL